MDILEFLDHHEKGYYEDLKQIVDTFTLNMRLPDLLLADLVQDHTGEQGELWYYLTEKGSHIVHFMKKVEELVGRCSNG